MVRLPDRLGGHRDADREAADDARHEDVAAEAGRVVPPGRVTGATLWSVVPLLSAKRQGMEHLGRGPHSALVILLGCRNRQRLRLLDSDTRQSAEHGRHVVRDGLVGELRPQSRVAIVPGRAQGDASGQVQVLDHSRRCTGLGVHEHGPFVLTTRSWMSTSQRTRPYPLAVRRTPDLVIEVRVSRIETQPIPWGLGQLPTPRNQRQTS